MTGVDMGLFDPQRVMLLGDTHHDLDFISDAIVYAADYGVDTIFQLGDFGYWPNRYPDFPNQVDDVLRGAGIQRFYWIDGNHENFDEITPGMRIGRIQHVPRGYRWSWWGKTWMGVGGGATLNRDYYTPGWDWFPQETLTQQQFERCMRPGTVDIVLSHDCPDGVDIPGLRPGQFPAGDVAESEAHRDLIGEIVDRVDATTLYHGHYHRRYRGQRGDLVVAGLSGNEQSVPDSTIILTKEDVCQ